MSEVRAQGHQLVTRARRGPAGTSAIWLDLNNENDSILYDGDGNKLSDNVVSTAKLYDGGVDVTSLVANWSLSLNGCSGSNAANVITITALSAAAATATLSCTYKSQTFSIVLSIKKIVGTVKYDLVVSPDAISYNTTTQVKSSDTINVKIYRTAQKTGGIMTREFVTAIPANVQLKVDGTAVASSSYNSTTGYTFNVDVSKTSHVVSLLQDSVLTDEETIPIGNVVNGEDGEDAIRLDLNNENDSLLYDAEGNLLSGNVTSVATLYSGEAPVASGVTYAIKERSGCTAQQATISGNTVNVSGINSSGYVIVSATYKNKEYTAKFSLKRLVGTVKYDLVVSPDAVSYNTTTGDKSSATVNVKIYRTAQNNSDGVTRQAVSSIPSGYTLKVDNVAVSSASYGANGYTFNVDVSRSSHVISLYNGSTLVDEETVPINKSTNGNDGRDGTDGTDGTNGVDGDGIIEVYMWSQTKPSAPTGTSKTPSGWSDSPNRETLSFTYRNEDDTGASSFYAEGIFRRNPKITDGATIAERIKFTTTKANQIIYVDLHADTESASYDYLAVSALDSTSWGSDSSRRVGGTNGSRVVAIPVATPGEHFIIIGYRKDSSVSKGKDYGWYRFVPDENLNCWFSRGVIDGATGTVKSWSDPLRYYADSADSESVYLLADSTTTPDTPVSDAYTDDYIPPRSTTNFNGTQSCALNSIVMYNGKAYKTISYYSAPSAYSDSTQYVSGNRFTYQGEAYKCILNCPSSGIDPSNTTYFEVLTPANTPANFTEVPTWTDDPSDVSATYRYQFISERKKTNGAWGAFSTPRLYNTAGIAGIVYRTTYWQANTEYHNDLNSLDADPRVIDIATNMPMAFINDANFKAYQCIRTHTSNANTIPLGASGYWAEINTMSPIVTAFILVSSIKAQYIDVADLAANTAFINALTVKHLEAADGVFYGTLQFPFVDMVQNITLDHTAGSGTSKYFVMESDDPTSLYLKASDRYSGTPYSSGPIYNYLELPSDMPDGVIVNIISDGKNVKNVLRPFYLHVASGEGNKINYGTNPDSGYIGNSILSAHMLTFPDLFFIRLLSFGGEWYVVQILGQFTASTES